MSDDIYDDIAGFLAVFVALLVFFCDRANVNPIDLVIVLAARIAP